MKLSWFALPLVLGASAASIEERATCVKTANTFDELTTPNVVDALKPVGTYKGLKYGGFSLSSPTVLMQGFPPNTKPNVITAQLTSDPLNLATLSLTQTFGTIAATGTTKGFDLTSFYFACTLATPILAITRPQSCDIVVTGFYANGKRAPTAKFSFAVIGSIAVAQKMKVATLPATFKALKNVTIGVSSSQTLSLLTALDIDTISTCNY
ncbi:hypothetical protein BJ166DRAFT_600061 [Pestalotiopsis sp. NC0098]|nr:hypothetical protein BJ166DRAFT_600061 [Pestalotiopsis sp. NC0098]